MNLDSIEEKKKQLQELKQEYYRIEDDETVKKWKVLTKAYKIGKQIHGSKYSVATLSVEFDIPYTTAKRILSLDKATKKTWKLIDEGKISAFKVAQVLMTKNEKVQEKIIDKVIDEKLSTYQIKKIKVYDGNDDKIIRIENAVDHGYIRGDSAYRGFMRQIRALDAIIEINNTKLPVDKIADIITELENLNRKIIKKIDSLKSIE